MVGCVGLRTLFTKRTVWLVGYSNSLWLRRSSDWLSSINSMVCSLSVMGVFFVFCIVAVVDFCASVEALVFFVVGDVVVVSGGGAVVANAVGVSSCFDLSFFLLLSFLSSFLLSLVLVVLLFLVESSPVGLPGEGSPMVGR